MTTIQINHKNNTIEMTKKFYTESCKFGTDEYKTLQEVRRDYPGYLFCNVYGEQLCDGLNVC